MIRNTIAPNRMSRIAFIVSVVVSVAGPAMAATMSFQNGGSPTAGYASGDGVTIRNDKGNQDGESQIIVGLVDGKLLLRACSRLTCPPWRLPPAEAR